MSNLKYKTKANTNPKGKPRVYFSSHPDDFDKYFEQLSNEILELQNCAVWYKESAVKTDEEMLSYLKEMQLFVMPITTKLLCSENDAIDKEFKFAIENHIPVLPLMQESGLDELFGKKCGDLQYLSRESKDMTEIPYKEKLEKYLSSVLIGDELAEKIRQAFDAYIFLSYRKKDRKYAQELMKLIHQNEFCRDIAIWYDEFLTPGEDFNSSIKDALEKSGLFVLAVTPNLVNETNYVMTTEYPMAIKKNKPILPVEMIRTNKWKLSRKYREIPKCTRADDKVKLSKSLITSLKNIAIKDNDKDPRHNFFIGLAYLGGVDVEVDHERAVSLITFSAEAGLPEAMEKLVSMYRSGEGVKRDYDTAISWQEKLCEYYEALCKENFNVNNLDEYCIKLWDLGIFQYEKRWLTEAQMTYKKMVDICTHANQKFDFKRNLSISYSMLGNIAVAQGDKETAKDHYERAFELAEQISNESGTIEAKRDLSISYNELGDIANSEGDLKTAKYYYEKSLELAEQISNESGTIVAKRDLPICYTKLGNVAKSEGDLKTAKYYYEKSLELAEQISNESGTIVAKRDLSISYNKLGDIANSNGDIKTAKDNYEKALKIIEYIAKECETIQSKRDLLLSNEKLGDIALSAGDIKTAKENYQKSFDLAYRIANESNTVQSKIDLSVSYTKLGDIAKDEGDLKSAKECYKNSLEIAEQIAVKIDTLESRKNLSISYEKLGNIAVFEEDIKTAKEYYEKSFILSEQIAKESEAAESKRFLSVSYNKLGNVAKSEGDLKTAKYYYEKSLEIAEQISNESGTIEAKIDLSISYNKLGDIANSNGDIKTAKVYYEKSLGIRELIAKESDTVESKRNLSISYEYLGNIAKDEGDLQTAKDYYEKTLIISEIIAKETSTDLSYDDLALSYYLVATVTGDKSIYQKAYDIWTTLAEKFPENLKYRNNADYVKKFIE